MIDKEIRLKLLTFKSIQEFNKKHGNNHDKFIYSKKAYEKLIQCILPSIKIRKNIVTLPCKSPYLKEPYMQMFLLYDERLFYEIVLEANFQTLLPIYRRLLSQNDNKKLKARVEKLYELTPPGFIYNEICYLEQFVTYALKHTCDYNEYKNSLIQCKKEKKHRYGDGDLTWIAMCLFPTLIGLNCVLNGMI